MRSSHPFDKVQDTASFAIRSLKTYDEFLQVHQVQQTIWGFGKPGVGLYPPFLFTASKNGGVVLGAFDPEDRMLGFIFSFLGREPGGPLKLCSQTMGVLAEWRGQGVATALKWGQRQRALEVGLSLITWTFDPLESANARLNMRKLGAVSRRYWRNIYGEHFGALNEGLPTDRLLVEWWIRGQRVENKTRAEVTVEAEEAVPILQVDGTGVTRRVTGFDADLDALRLALEVPTDIQGLKRDDMSLAIDWRLRVREAFETYLDRGYIVTDFVIDGMGKTRRGAYILEPLTDELRDWVGIG
jgi:predicted GNAT superfamily acetyltransferase